MLKHLHIRNLAIIDELALDLAQGFTALTGETGAGKSILIDALGLVTGSRADPLLVRHGEEKADLSAEFALNAAAQRWLQEHELQDPDQPQHGVLRRVLYAEGRTRAFINGHAVNASQLRELGALLLEIFGQNENQSLMLPGVQRELLDGYGDYPEALAAVATAAGKHAELAQQIDELRAAAAVDPARLDFLRFQLQELQALALSAGELEELEHQQRQLANAERILQQAGGAQETLYGGDSSVYDQLSTIQSSLDGLVPLNAGFAESLALVETAQAQIREAADSLKQQLGRMDLDPERLATVESRLTAIHELARKHRLPAAQLPEKLSSLEREVEASSSSASRIAELERKQARVAAEYTTAANVLSDRRKKAARKLSTAVTEVVRTLGMPNAQFGIVVEAAPQLVLRAAGSDDIRFDFSANPGQPPRPLAKVASGGELSRVSLGLQVAALARGGVSCMIFDEVDAGIGGGVAEIVGHTLRKLGAERQVLCVTHLAQVAAQAHQQMGIHKQVRGGKTFTRVAALDEQARVEELGRMQGGVEVTDTALDHARELLKRSSRQKALKT